MKGLEHLSEDDQDKIVLALLEAIWIMRWNDTKTAMTAALTVKEANKITNDIVKELNKAGFEIVKKNESPTKQ